MSFQPGGGINEILSRISEITERFAQPKPPPPTAPNAPKQFQSALHKAAQVSNVDPKLLAAVVQAESGWNPKATSRKGAMGLMQLMPDTARGLGVTDPYDPKQNLLGGARFLREMLDQFGDLPKGLAAYNAGPGAVNRHQGIPPYPETRNYVRQVMDLYKQNQP